MVELGTGYYCEKDLKGATDLINRKVAIMIKNDNIYSINYYKFVLIRISWLAVRLRVLKR